MDGQTTRWVEPALARRIVVGTLIVLAVWIGLTKIAAPCLIRSAYQGRSLPVFNQVIVGQREHSVHHYLQRWDDRVAIPGIVACVGFVLVLLAISSPLFFTRCVGATTPGSLGAIRMLVCALLCLSVLWERFSTVAFLPAEVRQPMGLMRLWHLLPIGFERFLASQTALRIFQGITALLLFLGAMGLGTRLVLPLGAVCFFVFAGILREYSFFWHQHLIPLYLLVVLSFTPCADGWSVDRLWKIARGQPVPPSDQATAVYGWGRYACWTVVALAYVAAGLSKLRNVGPRWWSAANMRHTVFVDSLNPMQFNWHVSLSLVHAPDLFFVMLAFAGVFGEVLYGLVLVSRISRWILPLLMGLMHVGIVFLQNVLFIDLLFLQLIFFDWTAARRAIGRWLAARYGRLQVLYDGWCPLCRRTVRVLTALDLFERLELLDFRGLDLASYNRQQGVSLTPQELAEEMYVVAGGRFFRGFYGYRRMALALPVSWVFAPWLFVPGVSTLGAWVYRVIARNRLAPTCDTHCQIGPADDAAVTGAVPVHQTLRLRYPVLVSCLTALLLTCWFFRVEYYPLTAMQMYATPWWRQGETITYYTVSATRASGETSKTSFDDAVGILALNGRYRPLIKKCFVDDPKEISLCKTSFVSLASGYNRTARPDQEIAQMELQQWTCEPLDPVRGTLKRRVVMDVLSSDKATGRPQDAHDVVRSLP